MSVKSVIIGGILALAAIVTGNSTAQAQFLPAGGHHHSGYNQTVIVSRPPIYTTVHSYGGYGTPLYTGTYFQPRPAFYAPVYRPSYGYGNSFDYSPGFGGGYNNFYGNNYGRPGLNLGFNFNFR